MDKSVERLATWQAFFIFELAQTKLKIMKTAFLISCTLLFSLAFQAQDFKVPKKIKLDKAEDYAEYEDEVLRAIEWLKNTPLTEQKAKRKKVNAFLLRWMTGTPDISITVDLRISLMQKMANV